MSQLGNVPRVEVVFNLEPPFVLEALAARFRGRVDSPLLRGGVLSDALVLREEFDDPLAQVHGGEWSY